MTLNEGQQQAVDAIEGTIVIDAVAGSGKTHTLVNRVKNMIDSGVKPGSIMLTTFTKKATEEMTERLSTLIPKMKIMQMTIGTTHSIGYRILAKEYENLGDPMAWAFKKGNVLMNSKLKYFAEDVVKSIIHDRSVPFDVKAEIRDMPTPQLLKVVASSKNQGISWQEYEESHYDKGNRMDAYIEFYRSYEIRKEKERAIDGDDMLYLLWRLFKEHPEILAKYQKLYKYIMVDEAQDSNLLQYELYRMLAYPENNLLLVGDVDQSMYSFRGARPDEFMAVAKIRGTQRIALEHNYRSNPDILRVANNLIYNNTQRLDKHLVAHKEDPAKGVYYNHFKTDMDEANSIAQDIENYVKSGIKYKNIAILYRTNAQSKSLEEAMIVAGIPYVIHGGVSFYDRKEIKDILSYFKLAYNQDNDEAFQRVINVPSRFLGRAFMEKVKAFNGSHWSAIQPGVLNLKNYEIDGVMSFLKIVNEMSKMIKEGTPLETVLEYLMYEGGYEKHILGDFEEDAESSRLENIETLKYVLSRHENMDEFMEYVELMTSKAKYSVDGVQLMTFHKSKGLEFPICFITGVTESVLPHHRSIEAVMSHTNPYAVEEERRLMYVGLTRAETVCHVSSIGEFNGHRKKPSRFIGELMLEEEEQAEYLSAADVDIDDGHGLTEDEKAMVSEMMYQLGHDQD